MSGTKKCSNIGFLAFCLLAFYWSCIQVTYTSPFSSVLGHGVLLLDSETVATWSCFPSEGFSKLLHPKLVSYKRAESEYPLESFQSIALSSSHLSILNARTLAQYTQLYIPRSWDWRGQSCLVGKILWAGEKMAREHGGDPTIMKQQRRVWGRKLTSHLQRLAHF